MDAEQLANVDLFSTLPKGHLKKVAKLVEERVAPKGEVLVHEGTLSTEFFVVIDGTAEISVRGRRRASSGKGDFFGELAIIAHTPRSATVTAVSDMKIGVIGAQELQDLLESEPQMALYMLKALAQRFEELATRPLADFA